MDLSRKLFSEFRHTTEMVVYLHSRGYAVNGKIMIIKSNLALIIRNLYLCIT